MPLWVIWGCETLAKSETWRELFWENKSTPRWLPCNHDLPYRPRYSSIYLLHYNPVWLWFTSSIDQCNNPEEICPPMCQVIGIQTSVLPGEPMNTLQPFFLKLKSPWITLMLSITYMQQSLSGNQESSGEFAAYFWRKKKKKNPTLDELNKVRWMTSHCSLPKRGQLNDKKNLLDLWFLSWGKVRACN